MGDGVSGPPYVVGIDGGGSTLRVVVARPDLSPAGQSSAGACNPSAIGRPAAAAMLRRGIEEALAEAGVGAGDVAAVAAGVAGAAAEHSADWLRGVLETALPRARVVVSADYEIALVGAHGRRQGILVLAGTGSVAYGVNAAGRSALVDGWGYLLGDEGSGYWLGMEGLRALARAEDGRGESSDLTVAIAERLGLAGSRSLIGWLYHGEGAAPPRVAALAPLVLEQAERGDGVARGIVARGAEELALKVEAVARRLDMAEPRVAFAGGLLAAANPLSEALCRRLGLAQLPLPLHPPVVGAVLLALEAMEDETDRADRGA